jgi:hypothetical protein
VLAKKNSLNDFLRFFLCAGRAVEHSPIWEQPAGREEPGGMVGPGGGAAGAAGQRPPRRPPRECRAFCRCNASAGEACRVIQQHT